MGTKSTSREDSDDDHADYKAFLILMKIFAREFYPMRMAFEEFGRPPYREDVNDIIKECKDFYPDMMSMEKHLLSRGFDSVEL